MPEFYTLDYAFWVKLLAILLLGGMRRRSI